MEPIRNREENIRLGIDPTSALIDIRTTHFPPSTLASKMMQRFGKKKVFVSLNMLLNSKTNLVGYMPRKDCLIFVDGLPTLTHEIGHMVEMQDIKRCILPDMGMIFKPNAWRNNELSTAEYIRSTVRELRARAIESVLGNYDHALHNNKSWGDKIAEKTLGSGRFKTRDDIETWMRELHEKTVKAYNHDRIEHDWNVRVDYILNWMETESITHG